MGRAEREESLINFQILALMCLIALSFAASLAGALPRWTPQRRPCRKRAEFHLRIFSLIIIRCTIAAAAAARRRLKGVLPWRARRLPVRFFPRWPGSEGQRGPPGERGTVWPDLLAPNGASVISLTVAVLGAL